MTDGNWSETLKAMEELRAWAKTGVPAAVEKSPEEKQEALQKPALPSGKLCLGKHLTLQSNQGELHYRLCGWDSEICLQVAEGEKCPACERIAKISPETIPAVAYNIPAATVYIEKPGIWVLVQLPDGCSVIEPTSE